MYAISFTALALLGALDARALSQRIDALINARLAKENVPAAPPADDATFFRRLSLDVNGRVPSVVQLRDFLDDPRPDKRPLWVDELLNGRDNEALYVQQFTNVWRRTMLANTGNQLFGVAGPLEGWLKKQIQKNVGYDALVRGVLTDAEARAFYTANENKPETIASSAARLFLGVKIECAQCHDHPFAKWKRQQFWEQAAFFAPSAGPTVRANAAVLRQPSDADDGPGKIKIADSETFAEARFLDGKARSEKTKPRAAFAEWLTSQDNPWFARAAVNRLWAHFFGTGLVDPIDGFGSDDATPSHPELLDELAAAFVASNYDVKYLIRALAGSATYARGSKPTHPGQADPRLFARARPRGLSAEQLFDSLTFVAGYRPNRTPGGDAGPFGNDTLQVQFLSKFDDGNDRPAEAQTSIPQALLLMNGRLMNEATDPEKSRTLATVLSGGTKRTTAKRIEDLYLVTLSRKPRPEELARSVAHVESGDVRQGLRDVFWALLNSTEFALNH